MLNVILFELRFRRRQVSTYLFFAILFCVSFLFIATDTIRVSSFGSKTMLNAPYQISQITAALTALGGMIGSALLGTAIYRDFESNVHELFFTTRLTKTSYFVGRFVGAYLVSLLVFSGILFGLWFGSRMPWLDRSRLLPFSFGAYFQAFALFLAPNLLLMGALFYTFGALTRSLLAIYVQSIVLLVGYILALSLLRNLDNRAFAGLFDPFGMAPLRLVTYYWTVSEQNTRPLPLAGTLLANRLLWLALALLVFALGCRLFSFSAQPLVLRKRKEEAERETAKHAKQDETKIADSRQRSEAEDPSSLPPSSRMQDLPNIQYPNVSPQGRTTPNTFFAVFCHTTGFYLRDIVRSVPFLIISGLGMLLLVVASLDADEVFGTRVYPVTRVMVETVSESFAFFFLILIIYFAGELTWRERVLRLDQIADTQAARTTPIVTGKIAALVLMQCVLLLVLMLAGMLIQLSKGYAHLEPGLYLSYLFGVKLPEYVCLTLLAFAVHTVVNNKFFGHTVLLLCYAASGALSGLGVDHHLLVFASTPAVVYSDMNGYGPFAASTFAFYAYWLSASVLLGVLTCLLWVRGTETALRARVRRAIGQRTAFTLPALLAPCGLFIALGIWIFVHTNIRNEYHTHHGQVRIQAQYEKQYKAAYANQPLPRIEDVKVDLTLWPSRQEFRLQGTYLIRNKTALPISTLPIDLRHLFVIDRLDFDRPATQVVADKQMGFHVFELQSPLRPGEIMPIRFDLRYRNRGFSQRGGPTEIAANGTFMQSILPRLGYQRNSELTDGRERQRQGLPVRPLMAPLTDVTARQNSDLSSDSDWITFAATVRTDPDQIAFAPGYLQREWLENGRRCFAYKMDAPILNFVSFLSARYAVRRDTWTNGKQRVALEIYYHPEHAYNVSHMLRGMKRGLDYYTRNFSPYQFQQLRILEFPCYHSFAQSFPNTIPYSEGIGFIARVADELPTTTAPQPNAQRPTPSATIDYPFYVTAHEVAHQWWGHQLAGANVEGAEMLSESLAEYSALMVMEHEYGREQMQRFLRYDLDRYLRGRSQETDEERPLMRSQHQQYIHYAKGSLVFYALRDYMGEDKLNHILAQFLRDKAFRPPPYPTSVELVSRLRDALPPHLNNLIPDMFETITLYSNQAQAATAVRLPSGKWRVKLTVSARKVHASGTGTETQAPLDDWIEAGVFAPAPPGSGKDTLGKPLMLQKVHLTQPTATLQFDVDALPARAGIDPYNKLIDRVPGDNVITVTVEK